ncbi:TIGR03086 family metal-binding protein [Actinoallomurus iriomotensis]|uniref:TIGR03086 family protein n=1 Tax=Actinoallomurus iriomotensis TaxID=478107 RepID=A0A9W6S9L2_9ACTN|nr:TIGR03086 family metal-binding protein [Actinoallomurus iriomotensis]GLY89593.1 TIGR03086 family protein [Actinoallomurus iriomotensis]
MELRPLMVRAVEASNAVVRGIGPDMMDRATPCPEFDVRALLGHLSGWMTEPARAAALKRPNTGAPDEDFAPEPGWAERLTERTRATAEAWSEPAAWEGTASLSGEMEMPAGTIGGLVFAEFLLHGWDLAMATGQEFAPDDDLAEALFDQVSSMADMGRRYGAFGPEVPVPASASPVERALGLAGRDPAWRP